MCDDEAEGIAFNGRAEELSGLESQFDPASPRHDLLADETVSVVKKYSEQCLFAQVTELGDHEPEERFVLVRNGPAADLLDASLLDRFFGKTQEMGDHPTIVKDPRYGIVGCIEHPAETAKAVEQNAGIVRGQFGVERG